MKKIVFALLLACTTSSILMPITNTLVIKKKKSKEAAMLRAVGGFFSTAAGLGAGYLGSLGMLNAFLPEFPLRRHQLTFSATQIGVAILLTKYGYETTKDALRDLDEIAQETN